MPKRDADRERPGQQGGHDRPREMDDESARGRGDDNMRGIASDEDDEFAEMEDMEEEEEDENI